MAALTNYFAVAGVGQRYARARPNVHAVAVAELLRRTGSVARALDIGAGTGLSTRALSAVARRVIGIEPSFEMLHETVLSEGVHYVAARGELLPIRTGTCDAVTVASAYHWCDSKQLVDEIARVLALAGWLAIYDVEFIGASEAPASIDWLRDEYWGTLPWCPHNRAFDAATAANPFSLVAAESLRTRLDMTVDACVEYISTQASTINAVLCGADAYALKTRLRNGLRLHFPSSGVATMEFDVPFTLLMKM